jgi:DNA-binding protein Fis
LNGKRTNTLYLLDNKAVDKINKVVEKRSYNNITDDEVVELYDMIRTQLEKHALSIINREENVNTKAG